MADTPPTSVHIDPPMRDWRVTPRNGRTTPVIATGHQPFFWHPGILAKYLAADAFAMRVGGSALNVVVEHNPIGPLGVDEPFVDRQSLCVQRSNFLAHPDADRVPPNRLPASKPVPMAAQFVDDLHRYAACVHRPVRTAEHSVQLYAPIMKAYATTQQGADAPHYAAQLTAVLNELMRPLLRSVIPSLPTSELVTPGFVDRLLADPLGCVQCYNRAARAFPEARIRPLYLGRDVIETPLWAQDATTCTPVYLDMGDSKRPCLFTTRHNQHLDLTASNAISFLRPRAITLSAIMRSEHCDLFIHGSGGGVYDQVTERWWQDWTGEELAPKAVVTADLYLDFDVPVATREELARAVWFKHHLMSNVDRWVKAADASERALADEKRLLLDRMNDDRDKRRRAKAFRRVHAINAELRRRHEALLNDAAQRAVDARVGVSNAAIAGRRDWCFALYPQHDLLHLRDRISETPRQHT